MPDFTSILSKKAADVEKPKPKPIGTYLAAVQGAPAMREAGDEKMEVVRFKLKLMAPRDDVSPDELSSHPSVPEWGAMNHDIFVHTEGGVYALTQFLTNTLGIEPGDKSLGQMIAEAPGRQLLAKLKHRPFENKQTHEMEISTDIESTAHV